MAFVARRSPSASICASSPARRAFARADNQGAEAAVAQFVFSPMLSIGYQAF